MEQKTELYHKITDGTLAETLKQEIDREYESGWYVAQMTLISSTDSRCEICLVVYRKDEE